MTNLAYTIRLYGLSFSSREVVFHWNRRYIQVFYTNFSKRKNKINRIRHIVPDAEHCEYTLTHGFTPLNNFFGYTRN